MHYGYIRPSGTTHRPTPGGPDKALRSRVNGLEKRFEKIEIQNRVLWELVRDALKLTDADLKTRLKEIDLRDGVEDGAISQVPLRCPQCHRVSSSQHWKCMYCGLEFEEGAY
jgi:lipopolysaccharide biosynthesis regulator YciM